MRILDLFAGTGSSTRAFEDAGHQVVKVEFDTDFQADERDVLQMTGAYLIGKYGEFDFVWASPPCTTFSVASIGHHWKGGRPSQKALEAIDLVKHTIDLIRQINPRLGYLIENPRGLLRKQPFMEPFTRRTVTYCQYGDNRMKPTDLWGVVEGWNPRPMCRNGDSCHEAAPRGSRTGTQGLKESKTRSMIPYDLGKEIHEAICTACG